MENKMKSPQKLKIELPYEPASHCWLYILRKWKHTRQNKQSNQKVGKRPKTDISPKKTYGSLTNTWKDAQHHSLLEKCKPKPQWNIISHWSDWTQSKSLPAINAGEGVEKRESLTLLGMQTGAVTVENSVEIPLTTGTRTAIQPSNPTAVYTCGGNQDWKRHMYPDVHCSTVYNSQDMEAT